MKRQIKSAREILRHKVYQARPQRIAEFEEARRQMALGIKIRRLREEHGLTQQQLAEKIGTHAPAVSRIEDADYDGHSYSTLKKIADALGMLLAIDFVPKPDSRPSLHLSRRVKAV